MLLATSFTLVTSLVFQLKELIVVCPVLSCSIRQAYTKRRIVTIVVLHVSLRLLTEALPYRMGKDAAMPLFQTQIDLLNQASEPVKNECVHIILLGHMQEQGSLSSEHLTPSSAAGSYTGRSLFQSSRPGPGVTERLGSQPSLGMHTHLVPVLLCRMLVYMLYTSIVH